MRKALIAGMFMIGGAVCLEDDSVAQIRPFLGETN